MCQPEKLFRSTSTNWDALMIHLRNLPLEQMCSLEKKYSCRALECHVVSGCSKSKMATGSVHCSSHVSLTTGGSLVY